MQNCLWTAQGDLKCPGHVDVEYDDDYEDVQEDYANAPQVKRSLPLPSTLKPAPKSNKAQRPATKPQLKPVPTPTNQKK